MTTTPQVSGALTGRRAQACDCGKCEPITIMTEPQRAADGSWEVLVMFDDRPNYLTPLKVQGYLWLKDPDAAPPAVEEGAPFIYATEGPRLELDAMLAALVQAVYGACEKAILCDAPMPAIDDVGIEEGKAIQRWAFERATLPEPAAAPAAGEPTRDGPGTVPYRFHRLMEELEKRFQDPEPFSAKPAEPRYFAMLDAALAAATPSVPQTHPGETDTYIDSVVQAADAHGRMRNPATQRSLDGAKIDLGRHLRQIASSSKTAPPVQVEDYVLQRAADMLTAYAELVKATGQYAEQHYIPELEYVVSELRAARGQSEHG